MAQVDAKVPVTVYDCASASPDKQADCERGALTGPEQSALTLKKLDAWKKLGQGFVAAGGGVVYAIKEQVGIQLNVNAMLMLGSTGPVFEPSLGLVYGL